MTAFLILLSLATPPAQTSTLTHAIAGLIGAFAMKLPDIIKWLTKSADAKRDRAHADDEREAERDEKWAERYVSSLEKIVAPISEIPALKTRFEGFERKLDKVLKHLGID